MRILLRLRTTRPVIPSPARTSAIAAAVEPGRSKQSRVDSLLWAYRDVGYFYAYLNPLRPKHEPSRNYLYPRAKGAYEQLSIEAFGPVGPFREWLLPSGTFRQWTREVRVLHYLDILKNDIGWPALAERLVKPVKAEMSVISFLSR